MDSADPSRSFAAVSFFRTMDPTAKYSLAAGGVFSLLFLIQMIPHLAKLFKGVAIWISKHVVYPYAINRHRIVGPWTRATVALHLMYIGLNVFCLGFQASSAWKAGLRAGTLSLINMVPLFAGPHLGFLADMLGLSLISFHRIHRSAGWMSFAMAFFHVSTVIVSGVSLDLSRHANIFTLIASET
jgi:hypothetical protein